MAAAARARAVVAPPPSARAPALQPMSRRRAPVVASSRPPNRCAHRAPFQSSKPRRRLCVNACECVVMTASRSEREYAREPTPLAHGRSNLPRNNSPFWWCGYRPRPWQRVPGLATSGRGRSLDERHGPPPIDAGAAVRSCSVRRRRQCGAAPDRDSGCGRARGRRAQSPAPRPPRATRRSCAPRRTGRGRSPVR